MPHEYEFHRELRQLHIRFIGPVTDVVLLAADEEMRTHPDFDPDFDQLIDFRQATSGEISREGILELVSKPPAFSPRSRRAFLMPNDLGFGLGRMFEQMRGEGAGEIRVCRDEEEAARWLAREI